MTRYITTALINTAENHWFGYEPGHPLAYDGALVLEVEADSPQHAAEATFTIGNRMDADVDGKRWPAWCRSLSVGDVVHVTWTEEPDPTVSGSRSAWIDYAVAPLGFTQVDVTTDDRGWNRPGGRRQMAEAGEAAHAPEGYCEHCGDPVHEPDSLTCRVWRQRTGAL